MKNVALNSGQVVTDIEYAARFGDVPVEFTMLKSDLEMLAQALIKEHSNEIFVLQHQVSRTQLDTEAHLAFRISRILDVLEVADPRLAEKLGTQWKQEVEKAMREGKEAQLAD